jgi:cysteine desulfurase
MNYFDYAASSPIYPDVLDLVANAQRIDFANPGALHILGHDIREKINDCRSGFLKVLGASKEDDFIFTSSASESNNTVIKGLTLADGDTVVYCKADHPSVTSPVKYLAESFKITLKEIRLNSFGLIDQEFFSSLLDKSVKLVVLTHINNQSGVIADIENLSKLIKEKTSAHVHIDAVQSFGKISLKVNSHIDSLSITSHKIGGPKGVAGLYLKKGHKIQPLLLGGAQENGMRSSTESYPLIAGFFKAMQMSLINLEGKFSEASQRAALIRTKLPNILQGPLFPFESTSPYIISFVLPGISSDIVLRHLETKKVYISSTSACSSRVAGFNSSLHAMNIPEKHHKNFLRISQSSLTTDESIEVLIKEFQNVWNELKHILKK